VEIKKIEALLAEKFQEEEFTDCFLVDIHLSAGNKLEVFVDSDSGITFKKCQRISRFPLKFLRQYPKNIGRKLEVKLLEGATKKGTLTKVEPSLIVLEEKIRVKEGKKKVNKIIQYEIPFESIKQARVKISF